MKEKIKNILKNKCFWHSVLECLCTIFIIIVSYFIGFSNGLLIDNDIRQDFINENLKADKKELKPNVSNNNIKSNLSNFKLNSRLFGYDTFTMLVSGRTYNFINNVTTGQNAYKVSNVVSFDTTNFFSNNTYYESVHCDIYILYRPYIGQYYLKGAVWDKINNVSLRNDTLIDSGSNSSGNSTFLTYFYSNNIIDNSNTTFLLTSYPSYISSPTFIGDFSSADIDNNNSNFIDYFFVTFGANSTDAYNNGYNNGYNVGFNDYTNSEEYRLKLEEVYQNGINIGYESGIIEGINEYKSSQEYRDELEEEFNKGYQARQDSVEDQEQVTNNIWTILEKGIETTLNVLSMEVLPGIPLFVCIAIPILLGILVWVVKLGAQ